MISVRGLSSLDAWLCGSIGIFTNSFGFARCFCKPLFILEVIFIAWRLIRSLEIILQSKGKKKNIFHNPRGISQGESGILQPILMPNAILAANGKNRNILAAPFEAWKSFRSHFEAWRPFLLWEEDFVEKGDFRSLFQSLEIILHPF